MAGQIRMTPETMRTRATQTSKQADAVQNVIVAMDNLLQALRSEWEGDAMRGYEDRYAKIKPAFTNAKELLDEIAYNLRESARAVEETDRNIGSQFRK
ncbi:WXG100 family type VII secretion target [Catenibacterium mitsuokai]|uniref:WXG100 family type VII secretion target n=1 Tax=Catenibacterium mitsuokai TaxID=100886 RepID=UPI0006C1167C|nr:WXG100 family type VII secretion target [Catenibacterium mitsuokai]CUP37218.1 Virulence factor esxA [Catenibacterium mitsuokai]CUP56264.1 Virulence factor esxA [Roseburia hominis]